MKLIEKYSPLIGRIFLAMIFLMSGFNKITGWEGTSGYMSSKGMPLVSMFLFGAIVFELLGGLSVLLGFRARLGAFVLIIFLIPATLIFHDFWAFEGMIRQTQMIMFMKNLTIIGGLLMVIGFGSGPFSLDLRKQS